MKSITGSWFFASVKRNVIAEDGMVRKTTEQYVVDAMTFTECEARVTEMVCGDEMEVVKESKAPFMEVFLSDNDSDLFWYKVKVKIITLDEKTGKEKKCSVTYLVQAESNEAATKNTKAMLGGDIDYVLSDVVETSVIDVFTKGAEK